MNKEAPVSEDFTFPTITDNNNSLYQLHFSGFNASSLWYVSDPLHGDFSNEQTLERKSFSAIEGGKRGDNLTRQLEFSSGLLVNFHARGSARFDRDEERMDMLWEDLNDDLNSCPWDKSKAEMVREVYADSSIRSGYNASRDQVSPLHGEKALRMSKSCSILPQRKPNLLLLLKVLKKLFLIHGVQCPKRRSTRIMPQRSS